MLVFDLFFQESINKYFESRALSILPVCVNTSQTRDFSTVYSHENIHLRILSCLAFITNLTSTMVAKYVGIKK